MCTFISIGQDISRILLYYSEEKKPASKVRRLRAHTQGTVTTKRHPPSKDFGQEPPEMDGDETTVENKEQPTPKGKKRKAAEKPDSATKKSVKGKGKGKNKAQENGNKEAEVKEEEEDGMPRHKIDSYLKTPEAVRAEAAGAASGFQTEFLKHFQLDDGEVKQEELPPQLKQEPVAVDQDSNSLQMPVLQSEVLPSKVEEEDQPSMKKAKVDLKLTSATKDTAPSIETFESTQADQMVSISLSSHSGSSTTSVAEVAPAHAAPLDLSQQKAAGAAVSQGLASVTPRPITSVFAQQQQLEQQQPQQQENGMIIVPPETAAPASSSSALPNISQPVRPCPAVLPQPSTVCLPNKNGQQQGTTSLSPVQHQQQPQVLPSVGGQGLVPLPQQQQSPQQQPPQPQQVTLVARYPQPELTVANAAKPNGQRTVKEILKQEEHKHCQVSKAAASLLQLHQGAPGPPAQPSLVVQPRPPVVLLGPSSSSGIVQPQALAKNAVGVIANPPVARVQAQSLQMQGLHTSLPSPRLLLQPAASGSSGPPAGLQLAQLRVQTSNGHVQTKHVLVAPMANHSLSTSNSSAAAAPVPCSLLGQARSPAPSTGTHLPLAPTTCTSSSQPPTQASTSPPCTLAISAAVSQVTDPQQVTPVPPTKLLASPVTDVDNCLLGSTDGTSAGLVDSASDSDNHSASYLSDDIKGTLFDPSPEADLGLVSENVYPPFLTDTISFEHSYQQPSVPHVEVKVEGNGSVESARVRTCPSKKKPPAIKGSLLAAELQKKKVGAVL